MKNKLITLSGTVLGFLTPVLVFAQATGSGTTCQDLAANPKFQDLICYVVDGLLSAVVPLIFAVAIATFVWGVVQYVINATNETERNRGKQFMIWGIIGLAVMVSVWGLVKIVTTTFGVDFGIPQVQQ